jgi:RNA recognition motif-containing protein
MNIYVSNLPYSFEEKQLSDLFEEHGKIDSVVILKDKKNEGRSRGIGFVNMVDDVSARKAIAALHKKNIGGREITVKEADNQRKW